jgi:CheY-like chemotaxis protein
MASVLIVDDDPGVRRTVRRMLEGMNYQLREASTAAHALAEIMTAPPDLILLDLLMPGQNGLQFLSTLQHRHDLPVVPIVVITGSITSETAVVELGARGLRRKPFTRAQLRGVVETVLRRGTTPEEIAPATGCSVLIVEDDPEAQQLFATMLRFEGYQITFARNGSDALARLRENRPCAILLDLMMPVMDGWEFRQRQLSEPDLATIPVVCVTAVGDPEEVRRRLGITCLTKPVDVDRLLTEMENCCRSRSSL